MATQNWHPQPLPIQQNLETLPILKKLVAARGALAELKGVAQSIPRQDILINTLALQEAKDSSEVENIVTTHDELYKSALGFKKYVSPAAKEVQNYVAALKKGYELVVKNQMLTTRYILQIQETLERNNAGLRKVPGTKLKNERTDEVVYIPPQHKQEIEALMQNLEAFINNQSLADYDPIVKMAIIHFQFESIHPFYDGNGRTGRIINILYLVLNGLLDIPILYLSRYIIRQKADYYAGIQGVRDHGDWENWLLFMIEGVEVTAKDTMRMVKGIKDEMMALKQLLRNHYKFYSQDLLNHLFKHPYSKIEALQKDLGVSRVTASNYLNQLADDGVLIKYKLGRANYYVNPNLLRVLVGNEGIQPI